jgi:O-antigen polymerase
MYSKQIFISLWACLLILAPLYSQPNLGGVGLDLTFNIGVWIVAVWLIVAALYPVNKEFKLPRYLILLSSFPIYILLLNSIGDSTFAPFLFRLLFILVGFIFFLALFQCDFNESDVDKLLFIIVVAASVHSVISVIQVLYPEADINLWTSNLSDNVPRGVFQQVNVNASFLATAVIISIYLMSRSWYESAGLVTKSMLWLSYFLSTYIIFSSGSRIGILALIISVPLIVWARFKKFNNKRNSLMSLFILLCLSFSLGQAGIEKTVDKAQKLKGENYSNARVAMYAIGSEIILEQPMGHGIGSFLKVWSRQSSNFVSRHTETKLPPYVTHPHNEFLLWAIEAGVPAMITLVLVAMGIGIGLYNCGFQSGAAYTAFLIPISLHTQVELPFYISAMHWFIWLFIIYLVFRNQLKTVKLKLSSAMKKLLQIIMLSLGILSTLFLTNTASAQYDIYNFVKGIETENPPLKVALNNLYTKDYAEQLAMRSMLYHSIENRDMSKVVAFEKWALNYVERRPELKMYEDLISASLFLRPEGKGCDMITEALKMYAHNKPLKKVKLEQCK